MAKKGSFFLAGLLAAAAGAVGGLLLAPQSGKKTREDIKKMLVKLSKEVQTGVKDTKGKVEEVFGEATEEAMSKYKEIKTAVMEKVAEVKTAGKEIDKEKYAMIVEDIVDEYKTDLKATKNGAAKLVSQLKKDWEKVKKVVLA
jgi:gas vesicle protein